MHRLAGRAPFRRGASSLNANSAIHDNMTAKINELALLPQTGVSLQYLLEFGTDISPQKLIQSARFLHGEMPVRYAHRIKNLENLPHGLSDMPSVKQVREWYVNSARELLNFPKVETYQDELAFRDLIESIKGRHSGTLYTMAKGVHELKMELFKSFTEKDNGVSRKELGERYLRSQEFADLSDLHSFLDAFYMSRIGIRMLMSQHIALHEEENGWVGCICESTSPAEIALAAIDTARHMCLRQYGDAPEVELHGHTDFSMPFVPSHLHHMLFEVIKNSMRAVVEFHGVDNDMPPIKIVIADGEDNEDVSIKISDEGGGIPRSSVSRIWSYLYTTADSEAFERLEGAPNDFGGDSPLAGLGYGLPISRLFARYFGGDLQVISMEGYGTDAYLHLKRVGDASEPLP
ncbi:[Pyruvate dehydrogenase (acetyl-transferring)] kinase [Phytophthora citrophthora]|uniref:Protein-serine/threonine kinase n=1 Tax=Phytophthora citrophthora TaxID=4793 RepID=A0AAD9GUE4_9STRA|nr:[Pyruvate dehydrogenase (acetyl-transferring)] kinase [Phytophthora citrophthora]